MNRCCLIALLLMAPAALFAQKKQGPALLDSLLARLPAIKDDKSGVGLLDTISYLYCNITPAEGLKYARRGLALAQKTGWKKGEAQLWNDLGNNYQNSGAYPAALETFFKSMSIYETLGDSQGIMQMFGSIGMVYESQKDYARALEYQARELRLARQLHNPEMTKNALGNIGDIYINEGRAADALGYLQQALKISEAMADSAAIIVQIGNIGDAYTSLKQYPRALAYDFDALRRAEKFGDKIGMALYTGTIGVNYYFIAKDSIAPEPGDDSLVAGNSATNLARGIDYLQRGIAACRAVRYLGILPDFLTDLSEALALQGDYQGALAAYQQYTAVKDSLHNTANNEIIANLETKRAIELKDKDILIAKLKKRNERILFAGSFAVLLLVTGILFRSFRRQRHSNRLLSKEKDRSDALLLNILPAGVAEELKDHGASAAKQFNEVSVLFTDFVDFTGAAEKLSPQQLIQELNECFTAFDAIIDRNGLEKIKTIGDAYMAVCGLPQRDERHAQRTVQAAIEIRDFVGMRLAAAGSGQDTFRIRIGINSGAVVAGIVGVKKFAYDIWGDTVNTAARMEQHSEPGRINISQSTYELVKDDYRCDYRGKIAAKHKGEVEMYFVGETASADAGVTRPQLSIVG